MKPIFYLITNQSLSNRYFAYLKSLNNQKIIIKLFLLLVFFLISIDNYAQLKDKFYSINPNKDTLVKIRMPYVKVLEIDNELIFKNFDDIFSKNTNYIFVKPGNHKFLLNNNLSFGKSELEFNTKFGHEYKLDIQYGSYIDTINKIIYCNTGIYSVFERQKDSLICNEKKYTVIKPHQDSTGVYMLYEGENHKNKLAFVRIKPGLEFYLKGISNDGYKIFYSSILSRTNYFKPGCYEINVIHNESNKVSTRSASLVLYLEPNSIYDIGFESNSCYWCPVIRKNDSIISKSEPIFLTSDLSSSGSYDVGWDIQSSIRSVSAAIGASVAISITNAIIDEKNRKKKMDVKLSRIDSLNNLELSSIYFCKNGNLGWITAKNGKIVKTNDGGKSWFVKEIENKKLKTNIYFSDSLNGFATSDTINGILLTCDGGNKWYGFLSGTISVKSLQFVDNSKAWYTNSKAIYRTNNAGIKWKKQIKSIDHFIDLYFADSLNGWAIENNGRIIHTLNGGSTWTTQKTYLSKDQSQIYFLDRLKGWIIGKNGLILATKDGGDNWIMQNRRTLINLNDICFINKYEGWIIGEVGMMLHTTDSGENWDIVKLSDIIKM